ncbi:MAG: hypothetical protein KC483_11115 [Nitrosarchaeum sp.]|nr:hypothetical protein [Nitrosarchaeum sp.]MCA9819689.1 hypothetical protein [Nitrosarchaeum sp.]
MIWISLVFYEGHKISDEFLLEETSSYNITSELQGKDIGYYKIFVDEFAGEKIFVQILDANSNVIEEQAVQTKMSVGYFEIKKSGPYHAKITNLTENPVNLEVELGETRTQDMIPAGSILLASSIMMIIAAYVKMKNYKIAQPDENIS